MRWPAAEVEVNIEIVEALVRTQHPDLFNGTVREMPSGFDNSIWRMGEELVVRLPRRHVAVPLIESEQRWLPLLAPQLPLLIPTPIRVGQPSDHFPWPWTIAKWIAGTPGNEVNETILGRAAPMLGGFFRALHRAAPSDAPANEFRGVSLRGHQAAFARRVDECHDELSRDDVLAVWTASLEAPLWTGAAQWIHGDPHPANLIFLDQTLVGVIDFGDICAGDPATDLAGAFLALPFASLNEFFRAYGTVDVPMIRRTLGWAVHFGLMFLLLGDSDEPSYGPIGRRALDNAVAFSRTVG